MPQQRLVLVYGGRSSEHDVSIRSATEVLAAVDRTRFDVTLLGVTRQGGFRTGSADRPLRDVVEHGDPVDNVAAFLATVDVAFPLLHGPYGEDGKIQGLFECLDVPYVGSGVLASSLCMDKILFKQLMRTPGVDVPVTPGEDLHLLEPPTPELADRLGSAVGFPCFVKPANQGSSIGVGKATDATSLLACLETARKYDPRIVVEQGVDAREVELAVLGDGGPDTQVSLPGEIILPEGTWYDYDTKYEKDVATYAIPVELAEDLRTRLQRLALRAFRASTCQGLARVDFFVDRNTGEAYLNEVNTLPGFTSISMYPKLMEAAGVPYSTLISRLVDLGLSAHEQRAGRSVTR